MALPKSPIGFPKALSLYYFVNSVNNFVFLSLCGQIKLQNTLKLCYASTFNLYNDHIFEILPWLQNTKGVVIFFPHPQIPFLAIASVRSELGTGSNQI